MTTMDEERAGFEHCWAVRSADDEGNLGAKPLRSEADPHRYRGSAVQGSWVWFQRGAAWQRAQSAGVPEARVTGAWESARIGDFNAGWNACRDSAFTLMKKAAYMELDTTKRSIAIQDELRAMLSAAPAQPAERQEQHPDDAAVDRFAVAMKAKLAKSREKGRHGWQNASAAHLSSLLYRHVYKSDPLDVANLAMMLHQNGQAIELPHEARHEQGDEVRRLREALERATNLLSAAAGYATKMEPMPAKLLNAIDAELDASTGQEVES